MSILPREIKTYISKFITPSNGSREEIRKCGKHIKNLSLVNKDWMDVCENRLSNLKKDYELLPLGYPAAKDLHLFRNKEGIFSKLEGKRAIMGLLNYPTTVRFSRRAILKYKEIKNNASIYINAKTKSGKKIDLFIINCNVFSRVLCENNIDKTSIDFKVNNFKYDSSELSFEESFDPHFNERRFLNLNKLELDKGDTVTSFEAEYVLAKCVFADKTYKFATKFFNAGEFPEKIVLQIGVKENDDWDLAIHQRRL